jgi:hypothetical protein
MELYDLKDDYKNAKDGQDFITKLVSEYNDLRATREDAPMVLNKFHYIIGTIDALYFMNSITQEQFTVWCKYFGI